MEERHVHSERLHFPCLQNLKWNEERFEEGVKQVCRIFNVECLRSEQETILRKFFQDRNVYFSAPTGYGKSLFFQSIPIIADHLLDVPLLTCIVLVISPIKALMYDQVKYLDSVGVPAVAITSDEDEEKLKVIHEGGGFNIIFSSPESMLAIEKWRGYLCGAYFKENCVGVIFDEAHCISQWGYGTGKNSPFRKWYTRLFEMRALLDSSVKLGVFTATATLVTKNRIFETLALDSKNTFCLEKNPMKDNLKFTVTYVDREFGIEEIFMNNINAIICKREESNRTLIYCHTRKQCALIWQMFQEKLGNRFYFKEEIKPHNRLVEMFHAGTPPSVKEHIINEANNKNSHLRVIICTVAFGMGVNCAGFNTVIHFGPSTNMESYLQECGRAGRDGKQSICHLLYNSYLTARCNDDMKEYVYQGGCRRAAILKSFKSFPLTESIQCPCCDICATKCECDINRSCQDMLRFEIKKYIPDTRVRTVSKDQLLELQEKLKSYLANLQNHKTGDERVLSCFGHNFEFNAFQMHQVLKNCQYFFSIDDITSRVEIWRRLHANNILCIVASVFNDVDIGDLKVNFESEDEYPEDDGDQEMHSNWKEMEMSCNETNVELLMDSVFLAEIDSLMDSTNASAAHSVDISEIFEAPTLME